MASMRDQTVVVAGVCLPIIMTRDGETDVFLNKRIYKNFRKVQVMENVFEA